MKPVDLATIALGILCLVLAKFIPDAASTFLFVGPLLIGKGLPQGIWPAKKQDDDKTPSIRPRDAAFSTVDFLVMPIVFGTVLGLLLLLAAGYAHSSPNDPATGGCAAYEQNADGTDCKPSLPGVVLVVACVCKVSFQASVIYPVVAFNLKTGDIVSSTSSLGACYGLTYKPTLWYASGIDYCFSYKVANAGSPNSLSPATLALHLADYGSIALGPTGEQVDGALRWQWWLYFSPRIPIN